MQKLKTLSLLLALLVSFGFGAAWTGANSEPENTKKMDGKTFYVITTADELAWIAAQVNSGNGAINAVLANDIVFGKDTNTVNAQNAWTPIGKDSTHMFKGILDGAGYSVYGVYTVETLTYGGLVGVLDSVGVVRNVNMKKDSIKANNYVGGLVAYNYGTVNGCTNSGSVSSTTSYSHYSGGIVGYNTGTVSGCTNGGSVPTSYYSGGIVGYNTGTVNGCTNGGSASSFFSSYSGGYSGGIVGYNTGKKAMVKNSYSVAISLGSSGTRGGIAGNNADSAQIINCYYDSDVLTGYSAVPSNSASATNVSGMTTANMQRDQFAWILNTANGSEKNGGVWSRNGGYPIFANATYLPIYKVVFNDDGATSNRYTDYRGQVSFPGDPEPAEGYMFSGWYNAENVKVKASTVFSADQTLNAVYEELILRLVFIYGDSGEILDTAKVEKNEKFVLPEAPEKKGYEFVGWYDDGDKFLGNPGDTITVTDDLKILAKYEEIKLSSSSSAAQSSSSSEGSEALRFAALPHFGLQVQNRTVLVRNVRVGENFAVLDMQGRVLRRGIANSAELSFDVQNAGTYIVRMGTESLRVRIK